MVLMSIMAVGCATKGNSMNSSVTMMALNSVQPFVSKEFAERLGRLILEDRYPLDFFSPSSVALVQDGGDVWRVTFENELVDPHSNTPMAIVGGVVVPKKLTFVIRKKNAEIVDIL